MEVHPVDTTDKTVLVYTNYVRNHRAVEIMWAIFSMCFLVINIIVFIQPQWIGDTDDSPGVGYFGLYEFCELFSSGEELACVGDLDSFGDIISTPFKAATIFIGVSCLLMMVCVLCMLLFFLMKHSYVLIICGCIQLLSGFCMFLGCIIYPLGWDEDDVRRICGTDADQYDIDECGIRWAYILAIIGIFDVFILSILAFVLAGRVAHKPYWYKNGGALSNRSEVYVAETKSEPSMIIQPRAVAMPDSAHGSQYSHPSNKRSNAGRKGDFAL